MREAIEVDVAEMQGRLAAVLEKVVREQQTHVLTEDGDPKAALVPYQDYLRYRREYEEFWQDFNRRLDHLAERNAGFSDEEIAADIEAAREEVAALRAQTPVESKR